MVQGDSDREYLTIGQERREVMMGPNPLVGKTRGNCVPPEIWMRAYVGTHLAISFKSSIITKCAYTLLIVVLEENFEI